MAWRPHGRARVSSRFPEAFGCCDRCQFTFNLVDLRFQYDWAGAGMINKQIRVCIPCLDRPQPQLRAVAIAPDPLPVWQPRIDPARAPINEYYVAPTSFDFSSGFSSGFTAGDVMQTVDGPFALPSGSPIPIPE